MDEYTDEPALNPDADLGIDPGNDQEIPWDDEEIRSLLRTEDEVPVPPPAPPKPGLSRAALHHIQVNRIMTTSMVMALPPIDWFIEDLLPDFGEMVVHGDPGSRKTFIVLDWMLAAQHGLDWHGKAIKPGKVLYIYAEGVRGLPKRLNAWSNAHDFKTTDIRITWMPQPINFFLVNDQQVELWREFVTWGEFDYLVIDTLHKNMATGEENSANDVGKVFDNAKKIAGQAKLIYVHHDTKSKAGARGSGSIVGDVDNVIHVRDNGNDQSILRSDKIRDGEAFDGLALTFDVDEEAESIYLKTVGSPNTPETTRIKILRMLLAEPRLHIRGDICCAVGDNGATQRTFDALKDEGVIFSEVVDNPKKATNKMARKLIDVWSVDRDALTLLDEGLL